MQPNRKPVPYGSGCGFMSRSRSHCAWTREPGCELNTMTGSEEFGRKTKAEALGRIMTHTA